jgi:hypothetical protein
MRRIALFLILLPGLAAAGWVRLDEGGIDAALSGARLAYDNGVWQEFRASGRTLHNAGRDSWGYWETRGGCYCSQWPPADGWARYDVDLEGSRVRFVGDGYDVTEGRFD